MAAPDRSPADADGPPGLGRRLAAGGHGTYRLAAAGTVAITEVPFVEALRGVPRPSAGGPW